MTTELFITTPRDGTIAVDGTTTLLGTGTIFTANDVGKPIIIRTTQGDKRGVIDSFVSTTEVTVATAIDTTQTGCFFYIDYQTMDLLEDFPYSLNYAIADIRNPESRNSNYSKTIKLPGTKANNIIFDNIFEIDLQGSFNPNIRAFISVYSNYIPVFIGNLQLLKINREKDKIEYEVSIFGQIGSLFQTIADKLVTDLDLSALDEIGTKDNITDSWGGGGQLFYPLLNNARQQLSVAVPNWYSDQIAPAIRCDAILERILSEAGYTCSDLGSLYSETNIDKLYVPCIKNWRRRVYIDFGIRAKYTALGFTGDLSLVIERARTGTIDTFFIGGVGDSYTNLTYQTTIELDYGDVLYFQVEGDGANFGASDLVENVGIHSFLKITYLDTDFLYNINGYNNLALVADITQVGAGGAGTLKKIKFDLETSDVNNTWTTNDRHTVPAKHTQGFLPDNYKQRNFLLTLIKMFNLYIESDIDSPNYVNIRTRNNFIKTDIVDWTEKLDVGQEIILTPMGELDWKEYLFTWKADGDFANVNYTKTTSEIYGQRKVFADNDFMSSKKNIGIEASPMPLCSTSYNNIVIPYCVKEGVSAISPDNTFTSALPRFIYYDTTVMPVVAGGTILTLDGVNQTQYPFSGHLAGTPQLPTFDYNWASPRQLFYYMNDPSLYPSDNLYTEYWESFINEIADQYSKIMSAYFNLTAEDIRTLDFKKNYFINGSYFRLNKVIDYSPVGNTLTKCEFIRIRDAVQVPIVINNGDIDVVGTGMDSTPLISSGLSAGQVLVGDSLGVATAQTFNTDATIDSGAKINVEGLRGRSIQDVAPNNGDVYKWVAANSRWEPTAGGGGGTVTSVGATSPIVSSGGATPTISTSMATNKLIGRGTVGTGVMEEITLGTNLSLTGTTLNASGGGGTPGGANKQVQYNDSGAFGAEAGFEYDKTTNILSVDTVDIDKAILTDIATPTAPAANSLILFSKDQNGLSVPHILDENSNEIEITRDNLTIVRNTSGASISKGSVVYITGATGSVPNISKARANSLTTLPAYGIMYQTTANNGFGWMMVLGVIENFNLSAFSIGDLLYVSPATAGLLTATKPVSPNYAQSMGVVLNNGVGNGVLQVFTRIVEVATTQTAGTNDTSIATTAFVTNSLAIPTVGSNLYLFYNLS